MAAEERAEAAAGDRAELDRVRREMERRVREAADEARSESEQRVRRLADRVAREAEARARAEAEATLSQEAAKLQREAEERVEAENVERARRAADGRAGCGERAGWAPTIAGGRRLRTYVAAARAVASLGAPVPPPPRFRLSSDRRKRRFSDRAATRSAIRPVIPPPATPYAKRKVTRVRSSRELPQPPAAPLVHAGHRAPGHVALRLPLDDLDQAADVGGTHPDQHPVAGAEARVSIAGDLPAGQPLDEDRVVGRLGDVLPDQVPRGV